MAELNVSRKSLNELFGVMQNKKFVIPDYQRPYKWDTEKCEILWDDLIDFYSDPGKNEEDEYFLGTIVTCPSDKKNEIEIIDGQQRLTSLYLLLRAFYKKLEQMQEDEDIIGLKGQIAPCLWDVDSVSKKVKDQSRYHLESRVATESDNDVLHSILNSGDLLIQVESLYSKNYNTFYKKCDEYAKINPMHWKNLCVTILTKCIVLPIECNTQDTALTIFSTLNDRGLPLSDSDIFKAKIYKLKKTKEEKEEFTEDWKELTERAKQSKISLDDLFRYYTHIVRARSNDKSKEIALRKFYSKEGRLENENLMLDLFNLCEFWYGVNNQKKKILVYKKDNTEGEIDLNFDSLKLLHCLDCYPNDFWKYITSVYYYKNSGKENFSELFPLYLKKIVTFLYSKFIIKPTVNAIKDDIFQGCIDIYHDNDLKLNFEYNKSFNDALKNSEGSRIAKGLILLSAYLEKQTSLIDRNFQIEHIFPRKWQSTNYNGWGIEEADLYLERFGNKIAIEKKINIQAGNGYFGRKKVKYLSSNISEVVSLGNYSKDDWVKEDIVNREELFVKKIIQFFIR